LYGDPSANVIHSLDRHLVSFYGTDSPVPPMMLAAFSGALLVICALRTNFIVPGDLVLVAAGEPFPADGIVVDGADLQSDESTLTGEAYPVASGPRRRCSARAASRSSSTSTGASPVRGCCTGRASLRVVFTGGETLYGEIVRSAVSGGHPRTPLQSAIQSLVSVLVAAAAVMCLIMAWARLRQGYGWVDAS